MMRPLLRLSLARAAVPLRQHLLPADQRRAVHGCRLDPGLPLPDAMAQVAAALRRWPGHWVVAAGAAAAPFLHAATADLGLAVAGAILIEPAGWPGAATPHHAAAPLPLPFPALLVLAPGQAAPARIWGAQAVQGPLRGALLAHPAIAALIARREAGIAAPRPAGRYAVAAARPSAPA